MNCRLMMLNSLSRGRSTPPKKICIISDTLCAQVLMFSLIRDLMKGDLLKSRKHDLSFGFKRRSLNSTACATMWS
jgi:hypothetical protein